MLRIENKYSHKITGRLIIWLTGSILSVLTSLVVATACSSNSEYSMLYLLPLSYGITNFVTTDLCSFIVKSKVFTIIYFGYFIKMVITPFLFAIGGYQSFFYGYTSDMKVGWAVLFMCYEYLMIVFFCKLYLKGRNYDVPCKLDNVEFKGSRRFFGLIILLVFFLIFAYNYVPEIKQIYFFISDIDFSDLAGIRWDNENIVARGSIQRYIYSLFMFLWPIVRYVLPVVLIYLNYCKRGVSKKGVFISSIYILIPFVLLGGDNLSPFIASVVALIVILKLYGKEGKKIIAVYIIIGTVALVSIIIGKLTALTGWRGSTGITNLAQLFNSYFPGFDNVSIALNVNGNNRIATLFYDIYSGIPFTGSIFGLGGETLNDIFVDIANTGGQIVPWGCNIGYYFSYILSPIITGLFICFILKKEIRSNSTNNFWAYYLNMLFYLYSAFSIIIYSPQIYIRFIWNIIIPIYVIIVFSRVKKHH